MIGGVVVAGVITSIMLPVYAGIELFVTTVYFFTNSLSAIFWSWP